MLRKIEKNELEQMLSGRKDKERLDLSNCLFEEMDLSGWDLCNINFDKSDFRNVKLDGADLSGCSAANAYFKGSSLLGARLRDAFLNTADFRHCDLSRADISGADLFAAALHGAKLDGITADEKTKYYYPRCPAKGAFIGWKVCFGRRIVQLLVPEDALRLQGTTHEIRVNKAKVLSVRTEDYSESFTEAHSYVNENFWYRTGEWVTADHYDMDRFTESGAGIHIWMDREAAVAYLG
ncbi:MAG: pentapeptide repeat-containing protein [Dorea sp.]|nr:pentapeptide repeat-containing protein [Dorea sp.]